MRVEKLLYIAENYVRSPTGAFNAKGCRYIEPLFPNASHPSEQTRRARLYLLKFERSTSYPRSFFVQRITFERTET